MNWRDIKVADSAIHPATRAYLRKHVETLGDIADMTALRFSKIPHLGRTSRASILALIDELENGMDPARAIDKAVLLKRERRRVAREMRDGGATYKQIGEKLGVCVTRAKELATCP